MRQLREHANAVGTMAFPVRDAINTMPRLIVRLGPRGPSGVITMSFSRATRSSSRNARPPVAPVEPRTAGTPATLATASTNDPSRWRLVSATVRSCFPPNAAMTDESCHTENRKRSAPADAYGLAFLAVSRCNRRVRNKRYRALANRSPADCTRNGLRILTGNQFRRESFRTGAKAIVAGWEGMPRPYPHFSSFNRR